MKKLQFTTRAAAKKAYKISYLGDINHSAKTAKGEAYGVYTYIQYQAPANLSGVLNTCPFASPECRAACLNMSGRSKIEAFAGLDNIQKARIARTRLFAENPRFYMEWTMAEIKAAKEKAERDGMAFAVRLNGTSDILFEDIEIDGKTIFEHFPTVQFYDYTKHPLRNVARFPNYHITFSYTGRNWAHAERYLNRGSNVAVVFDSVLPSVFNGFPVLNGDLTDYRPGDEPRHIVGLKFKTIAGDNEAAKNSVFVVNPYGSRCSGVMEKAS